MVAGTHARVAETAENRIKLANMRIDLKFVELTTDVPHFFFIEKST